MSKRDKVRKQMRKRGLAEAHVLVICTGKQCAPRAATRALVTEAMAYVEAHAPVRLTTVGCLHVCKRGPIAATYPKIRIKRRVSSDRMKRMVDKLAGRARRSPDQ